MRKLGSEIRYTISEMGAGSEQARVNLRVHQVRERYRVAIESVYKDTAALHLAHTNNVIITRKDSVKTLIVYVDDSLFAAELNAQRELIKLKLLELFGEDVDDFKIRVSEWRKYRENHPFLEDSPEKTDEIAQSVPLDADEESFVSDTVSLVSDKKVRESLKKAMTADLEWKKGKK